MIRAVTLAPMTFCIDEQPTPAPDSAEIVAAVRVAGVCGSDIAIHRGSYAGVLDLPRVLGHEWSGEVVAVGRGVADLVCGDRIVSEEILWCGTCEECRHGLFDYCSAGDEVGFTVDGAFATHLRIPARSCHRIPDSVDFEAAAFAEPLAVAYNAVYRGAAGVSPGARAAVFGLGPIGSCIGLWLMAAGVEVVGVDPNPFRRELAISGNAVTLAVGSEEVRELSRLDAVFEASGNHEIVGRVLHSLKPGGAVVLVGHSTRSATLSLEPIILRGLRVVGTSGQVGHNAYHHVLRSLASGWINPLPLVTHRRRLADIESTFGFLLQSSEHGKVFLSPSASP